MTARLVLPEAALSEALARVESGLAEAVCAERAGREPVVVEVRLRPGVRGPREVAALGYDTWQAWADAWRGVVPAPGLQVVRGPVGGDDVPQALRCVGPEAVVALAGAMGADTGLGAALARARDLAAAIDAARGVLTPGTLRGVLRLPARDTATALAVTRWLAEHPDVGAWSERQLPVPGMHTKWLAGHGALLRALTGRDVRAEVRRRPAVAHVTYVDPAYRAGNRRVHDAWTAGDVHEPAYRPRVVLVVENRDCRLWFPLLRGAVVVEGGGKAATSLLAGVPWVRQAGAVVYWGDVDADGFAILDGLRSALRGQGVELHSILMDGQAFDRYGHLGVDRDRRGRAIPPASARLGHLAPEERAAYVQLATAGPQAVRRIEQERIPLEDALAALREIVGD